jgi:hypothetical protein
MTPQEIISEINLITRRLIEAGLCNDQKYPALQRRGANDFDIQISRSPELTASMKDRTYEEVYDELDKGGAFNLRMIDGALVQMLYAFRNGQIYRHRLCVFPSPYLETYEAAQDEYEKDELYADIVGRNIIRFPVRFDFCDDPTLWVNCDHAKSHLTLGQYSGCRIPVSSPLTPTKFMRFILRHFYRPAFDRLQFGAASLAFNFPETISIEEKEIGFLAI